MKTMSKTDWLSFVDRMISQDAREVIGVQAKGEKFAFAPLDKAENLRLDHDVTILPPKKYLLPTHEDLMKFSINGGVEAEVTAKAEPRILFGVHPYDLVAIQQMDKVYLGKNPDEHYKVRRENTLIVVSDVLNPSPRSFAASVGTHTVSGGYDLLVTDLGDTVAVEEGSEAGRSLLAQYSVGAEAPAEVQAKINDVRTNAATKYQVVAPAKENWNGLLETNHEHKVWDEKSEKCLECGTCTLVCPTCFCYDIEDVNAVNVQSGVRKRTWDGCLLKEFTLVAGGEVFRENGKDRYRHRYYRKGKYLPERFGFVACVGCGRCATQCLPDIADPADIFNVLHTSNAGGDVMKLTTPTVEDNGHASPLLTPRSATVKQVKNMGCSETYLELALDDGQPLGHVPGQFVEVSIFGYGEAPISISSPPGGNTFELVVRAAGDVTNKIAQLKPGEKVGIRGPMGRGFDTNALKGKNLLFIGGGLGIVPMRSLINYVLEHRADFGEVTILYGCKEPKEFLFAEEINKWHERQDINHKFTVDKCPEGECWTNDVGLITTLIPKVKFDPQNTTAVVIGPPIMYKFVIGDLKKLGMPDSNILVSLERKMKCGVGKCGHCQINGIYVCKEGPVFNYAEVVNHPEAF